MRKIFITLAIVAGLIYAPLAIASKANAFENSLLLLIFNNTDIANIGDAAGLQNSAAAGSLYVTLHTADPGEAGSCTTSEATFGDYTRQPVARSGAGWTVSTNTVTNANVVAYTEASSGSNTITYFGICAASSGASVLLYSGALTGSLVVSTGVTASFAIGAISISED